MPNFPNNTQNIRKALKNIRSDAQRVYAETFIYNPYKCLARMRNDANVERNTYVSKECLKLGFSGVNFDKLNNVILHSDYADKFTNAQLSDLSETAIETGCALPVTRLITYNVNEIAPDGYTEKTFLFGFVDFQKLEGCVFIDEMLAGTIDRKRDSKVYVCHCGELILSGTLEEIRLKLRIQDIKDFLIKKYE